MKKKEIIKITCLLFGALTLLLFALTPYFLDIIEPSKSIGQIIGENAKDFVEAIKSDSEVKISTGNSNRANWHNYLTIAAFISLVVTIVLSIYLFSKGKPNLYFGIGGFTMSAIGLGIYFSHLAIGMIGFAVIAILVISIFYFDFDISF